MRLMHDENRECLLTIKNFIVYPIVYSYLEVAIW